MRSSGGAKPTITPIWAAKTKVSLYIHPVWLGFLPSSHWTAKRQQNAHATSEDSDQTAHPPRSLIRVFAGRLGVIVGFFRALAQFYTLSDNLAKSLDDHTSLGHLRTGGNRDRVWWSQWHKAWYTVSVVSNNLAMSYCDLTSTGPLRTEGICEGPNEMRHTLFLIFSDNLVKSLDDISSFGHLWTGGICNGTGCNETRYVVLHFLQQYRLVTWRFHQS